MISKDEKELLELLLEIANTTIAILSYIELKKSKKQSRRKRGKRKR